MHSLRTRITLLTVCAVVISVSVITVLSVFFIRSNERRESEQLLLLLCETGERNLDYYFNSVQKSVAKVAAFAESDLTGLGSAQLAEHTERVGRYFEEMTNKTNGVLTYYYRIDPAISDTAKGFWYTDLNGEGFTAHEVTDISLYDTQDTSKLVWFTVPKHTGKPVWLPPYVTDNLDMRVISYNVPIYWKDRFVGVVGIEIDYSTMAKQVESIRLFRNGYAYLSDGEGKLFFHPRIDVTQLDEERMPELPDGALGSSTFLRYRFEGTDKQAAWLPLSNGMRLVVAVPIAETEGNWQALIRDILTISVLVLAVVVVLTFYNTRHITRPLEELTAAARHVDEGDYSFELEYSGDDEIGTLTRTFKQLVSHMKLHISDLNKRVFVDSLTSVRNKGAFSADLDELQAQLDGPEPRPVFAVGVFDCNDLKHINDEFGHDRGDLYLKTACRLICRVFQHSPVYRIGGDEFAVLLRGEDFENREELAARFERAARENNASAANRWEEVHVALGVAVFDPALDLYAIDTVRRADKIMYADKQRQKAGIER